MKRSTVFACLAGLMLFAAFALAGCASGEGPEGPAGPEGPPGPEGPAGPAGSAAELDVSDLSCTQCHNDTTLIVSKEAQFREASVHGTGEAFIRGESTNCAGCHGTEGAKARISAGLMPHDPSVEGIENVSPYDCRTCHQIHTTYTLADFALTGDGQPAPLEMVGETYDGGLGNLCANCHQIRNELPLAEDGVIEFTSTRFGTHHGVESQMLLGIGGLGGVTGSPSSHYQLVENTCVGCHMGDERNHTYEPEVERCQACHADAEDFDMNGVQTEVEEMLAQVAELLIASGIMNEEGRSIPGAWPEEVAAAMWNYKFVEEDQSHGVHNSAYTKALLEYALEVLQ